MTTFTLDTKKGQITLAFKPALVPDQSTVEVRISYPVFSREDGVLCSRAGADLNLSAYQFRMLAAYCESLGDLLESEVGQGPEEGTS